MEHPGIIDKPVPYTLLIYMRFPDIPFYSYYSPIYSIWENENNSLTWNKASLGWFPIYKPCFQWGRSEVVMKFTQIVYLQVYSLYIYMYI